MNSIEAIQIGSEEKWKQLVVNESMTLTLQLGAACFGNGIVVFGGRESTSLVTLKLSEEGQLIEDQSEDPLIPGSMS